MATRKRASKKQAAAKTSSFRWSALLFKLFLVGLVALGALLIYLDASIRQQFEGKRWALPAKVYARPLELYQGQPLSADDLKLELGSLGYRSVQHVSRPGDVSIWKQRAIIYTRGFHFPDGNEPSRQLVLDFADDKVSAVRDISGAALSLARLDPVLIGGIYPANNEDRELVKLDQVPKLLPQALISVEDRSFYTHHGVSPKGIARAMWNNLRAGHVVQGGSTLTQQLVKNYFLTSERSLLRKLLEVPMAMLLELHYSKNEILQAYLNEVYLGQSGSRAIHGFGLASQYYFGRSLENLAPEQLAMLAGLVKGPSYYDPRRHPQRALRRRNLVLQLLAEQGHISNAQAQALSQRPLGVVPKASLVKGAFPAYLDLVKRQLLRDYRQQDLSSEGLRIFTSLDPIVQAKAEASLANVSKVLERNYGKRLQGLEGALVVGHSQTGEVVAVVGGRDPRFQGFNRALDAVRPIGSLVKPAVYLTALEQPDKYTLVSRIPDKPVHVQMENGQLWEPSNFEHISHGLVPLHVALSHSYNLATANLGLQLGMDNVVNTLHKLGVQRDISPYPSTLLGALSLSPMEVMQMYQTIAANGFETPLRAIRAVTTANGKELSSYRYELKQEFPPGPVHLLQYVLQETVREGTAKSVYNRFPESLSLAGKTGTTNDQRDSWFAGFTGDYLAVAWLGSDDNRPTPLTGSSGALQVWSDLMTRLHPSSYQSAKPDNVAYYWVDEQTDKLTDANCEGARMVPFIQGSEPQQRQSCAGGAPIHGIKDWFSRLFGG